MISVKVNGEDHQLEKAITLPELIRVNKVIQPDMVSVQLNGRFVERVSFDDTVIEDGDEVDFLYFMGGGAL